MMTKRNVRLSIKAISAGATTLLIAAAVLLVGTVQSTASNVQAQGANKCSLKTIKGTYLFEARGAVRDGQQVLPYAEAGTWTLDGAGNAQGIFSASVNGDVIANQEAFTATYQQKSGCVFTALAPVGDQMVEFHLYTTDQGNTMAYFSRHERHTGQTIALQTNR
ncbi:MAG: hypothetical protein HC853_16705 [Anaerolineae bacterium]|nr:hypothetical protein [Anaerolineae bacterium]